MASNDDTIRVLNDLLETSRDGEYGFRACANQTDSHELRVRLEQFATACGQAATELQSLITRLGGKPDKGGTMAGALHRGWVKVRGTLSGMTDLAMLEECERGEDKALERYRDAMKQPLADDVMQVVRQQYEGAKRNHDQVRAMRDQMRAAVN